MTTLRLPHDNQLKLPEGIHAKHKALFIGLVSAGLFTLGGATILFTTDTTEQLSAGSLVLGATGLVTSIEEKRNERLTLENENIKNRILMFMFSHFLVGNDMFVMPDWEIIDTTAGENWITVDVEPVNRDKSGMASFLHPMKSAISSSPFGLGVKRFFFDRKDDQHNTKEIVDRLKEYEQVSPVLRELSEHLEHEETQYQLKALAKEACNYAMEHTEKEVFESLNLQEQNTKYQFYTDVYFYLRVWLKNSIEYDMEMPDIGRSIKDVSIYLKAFKFLRSERVDYFLVPEEHLKSDLDELVKAIRQYLDALIEKLESDQPGQGVLGRLLSPHR